MSGAGVAGTCAKRGYSWLQQRQRQAQTRQDLTSSVECSGFSPKCDERLLPNVTRICWTPKPGSHCHPMLSPPTSCFSSHKRDRKMAATSLESLPIVTEWAG